MSATSTTRVFAAFSRSNCETEPSCARAERNIRTASNDADIPPSLVRLGAQNGPQRRPFSAVPRRLPQQPDSMAERRGFELSLPSSSGGKTNLVNTTRATRFSTLENASIVVIGAREPAISMPSLMHEASNLVVLKSALAAHCGDRWAVHHGQQIGQEDLALRLLSAQRFFISSDSRALPEVVNRLPRRDEEPLLSAAMIFR